MTEISATNRSQIGKKLNILRREGILPAVLYGQSVESKPLSVRARDFKKALNEAGETSLVTLKVEGQKSLNVLIHDVAKDPRTLEPIHADFYAVNMDRPIEAKVVLNFTGESPAVKNDGGILVKVLHELEVRALPKDLPHEIVVDVSRIERLEDKIHVGDLSLPPGVAAKAGQGGVVALVEPPRSEAELEAITKPEETAPAEVKTEREIKTEVKEAGMAGEEEGITK